MPEFCFFIHADEFVAEYTGKFHEGRPERPATKSRGPLPAEDNRFEVKVESIRASMDDISGPPLELPAWLRDQITNSILSDDDALDQMQREHYERRRNDVDEAADRARKGRHKLLK